MTYRELPIENEKMSEAKSLLIVAEDHQTKAAIQSSLDHDYAIESFNDAEQSLMLLESGQFDCAIIDIPKKSDRAITLLRKIRSCSKDIPIIMLCTAEYITTAVEAVRAGASDFLIKEIELGNISERIRRVCGHSKGEPNNRSSQNPCLKTQDKCPDKIVLGKSRRMLEIIKIVRRAAWLPVPVLLLGESGTGKELFSRWIHRMSSQASGPFVAVNLAAIPQDLIESTLFGHVKGAFTGAVGQRTGKFLAAQSGTLLLDEIAELNIDLQPKLLRVLQEGEFEPVGGERIYSTEARIIAATNQDLATCVQEGRFRSDLFYRLNVITITLPPLRERMEDIPELGRLFLSRYNRLYRRTIVDFSSEAMDLLMDHNWPGNIRELENMVQRAVIVADGDEISSDDLSFVRTENNDNVAKRIADRLGTLEDLEHEYIELILKRTKGHQGKAAKILNIDRKTLKNKIQKYDLESALNRNLADDNVIGEIYPDRIPATSRRVP